MPLSPNQIRSLFEEGAAAGTAYEKGKKLELVIIHALASIPGMEFYKANVVNHAHSEEVDVAFFNTKQRNGLPFLEFLILVECKNWSAPVGAAHVNAFATKLQRRGCSHGLLIAANGITGDAQDLTAAHQAVSDALAVNGIRILVITRAELEALTCSAELIKLIKLKLCELTVARSMFV